MTHLYTLLLSYDTCRGFAIEDHSFTERSGGINKYTGIGQTTSKSVPQREGLQTSEAPHAMSYMSPDSAGNKAYYICAYQYHSPEDHCQSHFVNLRRCSACLIAKYLVRRIANFLNKIYIVVVCNDRDVIFDAETWI